VLVDLDPFLVLLHFDSYTCRLMEIIEGNMPDFAGNDGHPCGKIEFDFQGKAVLSQQCRSQENAFPAEVHDLSGKPYNAVPGDFDLDIRGYPHPFTPAPICSCQVLCSCRSYRTTLR
jgi:hypothetical protein